MRTDSRTVCEQPTAVVRGIVHRKDLGRWFGGAFDQVAAYLLHHGIAPQGFPFARYHVCPDGTFDVEAGFPVGNGIDGDGKVMPSSLPGGRVVVAWHIGPYDELGEAYQSVDEWLKAAHGVRTGDSWEVYHDPPTGDPHFWRTEVIQPFDLVPVGTR